MCDPDFMLRYAWRNANIEEFHIHIYANGKDDQHKRLAERIKARFPDKIRGPFDVGRVGPHRVENSELNLHITRHEMYILNEIIWDIQFADFKPKHENQPGVSVLIHPETGNFLEDHGVKNILWIGKPVPFNQSFFDRFLPIRPDQKLFKR